MIWLTIWGVIFFSFVTLDITYQLIYGDQSVFQSIQVGYVIYRIPIIDHGTFIGVTILKILGICLTFIYALKKFKKDYLLQIALGFTFLADILLLLDNTSAIGVLVFCLAQYFHISRFAGAKPKYFIGYTAFLVVFLFYGHFMAIPPIIVLGFIYGISLIQNIRLTRKWAKSTEKTSSKAIVASHCAFWGFILFAMCDTNVAISFFARVGVLPSLLFKPANFFAWLFYYPSQVLISNSSIKKL